jgi:hypothetical protein
MGDIASLPLLHGNHGSQPVPLSSLFERDFLLSPQRRQETKIDVHWLKMIGIGLRDIVY